MGIGSGGNYALAAARALLDGPLDAEAIVRKSLDIAADICVYTNRNVTDLKTPRMPSTTRHRRRRNDSMTDFSPREIVSELDRYIVGQNDAKRAVAIALRNRWRRLQLDEQTARGGAAEEHPDDRADRRRQDRDLAAAGEARRRAVPQGRGDQVHRGRLRRPRRRADRARPRRDRDRADARAQAQGRAGARPARRRGARARRAGRPGVEPGDARIASARSCAPASSTTRRSRSRCRPRRRRHADVRDSRHAGRADGRHLDRRHFRQAAAAAPRRGASRSAKSHEPADQRGIRQAARQRAAGAGIDPGGRAERHRVPRRDRQDRGARRPRRRRRLARRRAARPAAADRGHDGRRPSTAR